MIITVPFYTSRLPWFRGVFPVLLGLLLFFWGVSFSEVQAAPPQSFVITGPTLRVDAGTLFADMSLSVDDEDGLRDLLKDGAILELAVSIDMERRRSWWADATVTSLTYTSSLRHDPLTREFHMTMPRKGGDVTIRDRNLTRLINNSWRSCTFPIVTQQALSGDKERQGRDYTVNISLRLHHTEVPPWLEKSPVFWSSDVVPEAHYTLTYNY